MRNKIIKKKGEGLVMGLINGVIMLVISVVIGLVIVATILDANLLGAGAYNDTAQSMAANLSAGINKVSDKIPTILLIAAVVLLLGVLVFLVVKARQMNIGGSGGSL